MRFFRLRSSLAAGTLRKRLDSIDAVAIEKDFVKSVEELELADHLARKSVKGGKNIAKQERYEFLLWLAGKTDIKSAMKATSLKEKNDEFLIVVFSEISKTGIISKLKAEILPLKLEKDAQPLDVERISLSRI